MESSTSSDDYFKNVDEQSNFKTVFLLDNSEIDNNENKFHIQIDVCSYMFRQAYKTPNCIKYGIVTYGSEEEGVRCSPTNEMNGLKVVLDNIKCHGFGNLFNGIKSSILCFNHNRDDTINRIHCFLSNDYEIKEKEIEIIQNLCEKNHVILDLFITSESEVDLNQYKNILSETSICKHFDINEHDPFAITQEIIDDLFDLYDINIIDQNNHENNEINEIENNHDQDITSDKVENDGNLTQPKKKIKRHRLQAVHAQAIYNAYLEKGDDVAKQVCNSFHYGTTTYYKVINSKGVVSEKYKHPEHKTKWDPDQIQVALNIINENPVLTLQEIIDKAVDDADCPDICESTLSEYLKKECITLKECRLDPVARNSDETKESRKKYCKEFLSNLNKTFVFIDEMGFSCCTQRNRGRSPKGKLCKRIGPLLKAPNTSVCMAVSKDIGIVHYSMKDTAFNGDLFIEFINELIEKCNILGLDHVCFIMDNVRMHKTYISDITQACEENNIELRFLPVYSPELNPIEKAFSLIKANIKKLLRTKYYKQLLDSHKAKWGQKTKIREQIITDALNDSLSIISPEIMKKLFNDMISVFSKVFNNEDI